MTTPTPRPFVGLMGRLEMEAALEVMVAKAKRERVALEDVIFTAADFPEGSYENDGFYELMGCGWLSFDINRQAYAPMPQLVTRVHRVMPGV